MSYGVLNASGAWLGSGIDGNATTLHYEWSHSISGQSSVWVSGVPSGCMNWLPMSGVVYAKLCNRFCNELPDPSGLYPLCMPSGNEHINCLSQNFVYMRNQHYINLNPGWRYKYVKLVTVTYNENTSGVSVAWWPPNES